MWVVDGARGHRDVDCMDGEWTITRRAKRDGRVKCSSKDNKSRRAYRSGTVCEVAACISDRAESMVGERGDAYGTDSG